jgi:hypothetical protein
MRYSIYIVWFLTVLSICVLTTLASLPGFMNGERSSESKIVMGSHGFRAIKIQRVPCNALKPSCHAAKRKPQPKVPA